MAPYPGREREFDLGEGHSFTWLTDSGGQVIGLIEHHRPGPAARPGAQYCGGYVAWRAADGEPGLAARHQLVAGGPGAEDELTISPSLACRSCPSHGFIRDGRWIPAG